MYQFINYYNILFRLILSFKRLIVDKQFDCYDCHNCYGSAKIMNYTKTMVYKYLTEFLTAWPGNEIYLVWLS